MKKNDEFNLVGSTKKKKGKWGCIITLKTPDGRETTLESDYTMTEGQAQLELRNKIAEVLAAFGEDIEVIDRVEMRGGSRVQ